MFWRRSTNQLTIDVVLLFSSTAQLRHRNNKQTNKQTNKQKGTCNKTNLLNFKNNKLQYIGFTCLKEWDRPYLCRPQTVRHPSPFDHLQQYYASFKIACGSAHDPHPDNV